MSVIDSFEKEKLPGDLFRQYVFFPSTSELKKNCKYSSNLPVLSCTSFDQPFKNTFVLFVDEFCTIWKEIKIVKSELIWCPISLQENSHRLHYHRSLHWKLKAIKINYMQMNCLQLCFNTSSWQRELFHGPPWMGDFNIAPWFNSWFWPRFLFHCQQ